MNLKQSLFLIILLLPIHAGAKLKAVPVLYPSYWKLVDMNSWSGRSRNSVQITLPPHTVKLAYVISSVDDKELQFVDYGKSLDFYKYKHYKGRKSLAEYLMNYYSGNPEDSVKSLAFLNPVDTLGIFGTFLFTDSMSAWAFNKGKPAECVNLYSFPSCKGKMVSLDMIVIQSPTICGLDFQIPATAAPCI